MKRRTKYSLGAVALLVVLLIGVSVVRGGDKAVEVKTEPVQRRDLVSSVSASGRVQPRTKVDVSADITGRITRLAVKEGDMVKKGQFLLEIDPEQYRAAVERSVAAVASGRAQEVQARANYEQAKRNYDRIAALKTRNPGLVSQDQLEQARTASEVNKALLDNAAYAVQQAQAALRDAQSALGKTTIVAPIDGQVTRLRVEAGETAIMGTLNKDAATLLTVADMSVMETKVKVDETDVAHIAVGDSAMIDIDAFPDSTFRGVVTQISSSSISQTGVTTSADQSVDYEVTIRLIGVPRETRPDFSTQAKIITGSRTRALSIPIIALTIRENTPLTGDDSALARGGTPVKQVGQRDVEGVFVVGTDRRVTFRPVRVGIAGEKYFEVLNGLKEGERVVAGPYQAVRQLKDGTTVREAKADSAKSGKR